jgi:hypothetical protein
MTLEDLQKIIDLSGKSKFAIEKELKIPNGELGKILKGKPLSEKYLPRLKRYRKKLEEDNVKKTEVVLSEGEPSSFGAFGNSERAYLIPKSTNEEPPKINYDFSLDDINENKNLIHEDEFRDDAAFDFKRPSKKILELLP